MEDLQWGLMMMVVGMGVVFLMLVVLMLVLMGIGRLDQGSRPKLEPAQPASTPEVEEDGADAVEAAPAQPTVRIVADGLDENEVAAISVAVLKHAENRRRMGAREIRLHAPGSQLFASRWLAVGRGNQHSTFNRK
ncbi:MAG: OadG family transporter subunit [Propionibacteriaceae bacterium]|nr:OadG family transporter subunit [Propionibacteriaceae bacterium]